jgi:hypothetical protein
MIAIATKLMVLITVLLFSQQEGRPQPPLLAGASWQSRLNSAPPGSAVWEKWGEKHSPNTSRAERSLVAQTTSRDLFISAKDLLISAMVIGHGGALRTDGLIMLNSRISCIHSSRVA